MTAEADYRTRRQEAAAARARLTITARELQNRLAPRSLAQDAWETVKTRGETLAEQGVEAARANPAAAAGAGVAATAFLFRRPLLRGLRRLFTRTPRLDTDDSRS